jgi:hypothetical protein
MSATDIASVDATFNTKDDLLFLMLPHVVSTGLRTAGVALVWYFLDSTENAQVDDAKVQAASHEERDVMRIVNT